MALLEILTYPDPFLRTKCTPVQKISKDIVKLLDDMAETMYAAKGIGLAASQIGSPHRVIVLDVRESEEGENTKSASSLYKIINPTIIKSEGKSEGEEGCLSIPDIRENVVRMANVVVSGQDVDGSNITIEATGLLSVCLQHEIDHLDGILFIDRLSRLKRSMIKSKLKKHILPNPSPHKLKL
ncbi:MAG: peptide deformylase [Deltaproteobacteria bacterium]|nr:peptide deformylase [Deltaproteobacteria bacterium]